MRPPCVGVTVIYDREIFDFVSGLYTQEISETALMTLCGAASAQLKARLREGVSAAEIKEQFVTAAGMLALAMYIASEDTPAVSSFRAGNLSVGCRAGGGEATAASLRKQAENILAAYLQDEDFAFLGVRG